MKRLSLTALFPMLLVTTASFAKPVAMIVSGGENPHSNSCDFYSDVKDASQIFKSWDKDVFVADGPQPNASPRPPANSVACDRMGRMEMNNSGNPIMTRRDVPGSQKADLTLMREQLEKKIKQLKPGEPVVFYFTDHGEKDGVRLWKNDVTTAEMRDLIKLVPPSNKVISVFDTCYGGNLLDTDWGSDGKMLPNACAISGTSRGEEAAMGESIMRAATESGANDFSSIVHSMTFDKGMSSTASSTSARYLEKYAAEHPPVNDSLCATCVADSAALTSIDSATANIAKTSLANEIDSIQTDIKRALAWTHQDPTATLAQINTRLDFNDKQVEEADKREAEADSELGAARVAYIKNKMGAKYDDFQKLDQKLEDLRESRDQTTDPKAQAAIDRQIDGIMPRYNNLSAAVDRTKIYVDSNTKSFKNFANQFAGTDGHPWSPDVFEKEDAAASHQQLTHEVQRPAVVLKSLVQRATALREMLQNNDVDAIQNYLRLLECESTPFHSS